MRFDSYHAGYYAYPCISLYIATVVFFADTGKHVVKSTHHSVALKTPLLYMAAHKHVFCAHE